MPVLKWVKIEVKKKKKKGGMAILNCFASEDVMGKFFGTAFLWDLQSVCEEKKKKGYNLSMWQRSWCRDIDANEIFQNSRFHNIVISKIEHATSQANSDYIKAFTCGISFHRRERDIFPSVSWTDIKTNV